jgi:hypothetical protein
VLQVLIGGTERTAWRRQAPVPVREHTSPGVPMSRNPEEDSDHEGRKVSPVEISKWYEDPRGVHKVVGARRGKGHTAGKHTSVELSDKLRLPEGVSESGKLRLCR